MKKNIGILISIILLLTLSGCAAYLNQPTKKQKARFGEEVYKSSYIKNLTPKKKIVVGVYKFRDQTGQYKQVENGVSYSTAVTQGATTILVKALEDSRWFTPIERENVSNLLNERQIIRSTRNEDNKKNGKVKNNALPPLLFAGILLEGGIISYDSNIITGGTGARYFGAGASTQYRQDRISIYLRAVSTSNGKILKTIYVSKTILSQALDINLFRFVNLKRLLEVETGITQNEPGQLAVKEAIEKAVESLIIEGINDNIWQPNESKVSFDSIYVDYTNEKNIALDTQLFNRKYQNQRKKNVISTSFYGTYFDGDYNNTSIDFDGFQIGYKYYFKDSKFSLGIRAGTLTLSNEPIFNDDFLATSIDAAYTFLPKDKLSPFINVGVGGVYKDFKDFYFKGHYGLGLEYLISDNLGLKLFAEHNLLSTDEIDHKIIGKRDDAYYKFGVGINFYLGQ